MHRLINFSLSFITVTLAVYVLYAASSFFIPLVIAFVISYLIIAIVEGVNADGSIKISESNVKGLGVISDRTFTAQEASQLTYIHY